MTIKKAYCYLFYKLYRFYESAPSKWMSDWKAVFSLLVLEIWILVAGFTYYKVFTKKDLISADSLTVVAVFIVIFLVLIKFFVFEFQDRWKEYVKEFDGWPRNKNKIGTIITWLIVLCIITNLVYAFYLLSRIDWKEYP